MKVAAVSWGRILLGDREFKDVKLYPTGDRARAWDWNETGMRHVPGISIGDVEELVERGSRIAILSRGMELVLQVPAATIAWLERRADTIGA